MSLTIYRTAIATAEAFGLSDSDIADVRKGTDGGHSIQLGGRDAVARVLAGLPVTITLLADRVFVAHTTTDGVIWDAIPWPTAVEWWGHQIHVGDTVTVPTAERGAA